MSIRVMKLRLDEYGPLPPEFLARTRQKYLRPGASRGISIDESVIVESSNAVVANAESIDTCKRYEDAHVVVRQRSVGVRDTSDCPFEGETSRVIPGGKRVNL